MKTNLKIDLKPFRTPNFVLIKNKDVLRANSSVSLKDLDPETLLKLCDEFKEAIFKKAGKQIPT